MNIYPESYQAYQLLHLGTLALARVERQGICIDMDYIVRKKQQLTNKIEYLEEEFRSTQFFKDWQKSSPTKININSNQQLAKFLYDVKGIKINKETASGKGSTDDEALKQMNIPELDFLLKMAKLKKIRDTYLEGYAREQVNGVIHPFFNLHLVTTYRSSCSNPNAQNVPKRDKETTQIIRSALKARPGNQLVEFDLSGAEVRIAACYHKDPTMIKYIKDPSTDMHSDLAEQLFKVDNFNKGIPEHYHLRQAAKNGFVFPEFYGDYYKNCAVNLGNKWGKLPRTRWKAGQGVAMPDGIFLSDHLISKGIKSFDAFTEYVKRIETDFWQNRFYKYAQWKDRWYSDYQKKGYFDFFTGFRNSGIMDKNYVINAPVQGTAFHVLLKSLILLDAYIIKKNLKSRIVGQIHDSILMDVVPAELAGIEEEVQQIVCRDVPKEWQWLIVPIQIDCEKYEINGSWADKIK